MPTQQIAIAETREFAAPPTLATVLQMRAAAPGGVVDIDFQNDAADPMTVSVEVSPDGDSWSATTSGNNVQAITGVVIAAHARKGYQITLRAGLDKHVRVRASGNGRATAQFRGHEPQQWTWVVG